MSEISGINLANVLTQDYSNSAVSSNSKLFGSSVCPNNTNKTSDLEQGIGEIIYGIAYLIKAFFGPAESSQTDKVTTPSQTTGPQSELLDKLGGFAKEIPNYLDKALEIFGTVSSLFGAPAGFVGKAVNLIKAF